MANLKGLETVMKNLNRQLRGVKERTAQGVLAGAREILAEAKRRVPVEYGDLRDSGYVSVSRDERMAVDIGFTAPYALSIHENMEQKLKGRPRPSGIGVYWGPSGQPKFLESAIRDKTRDVVRIVADHARVRE